MSRPRKFPEELIQRGVLLALESGRPIAKVPEGRCERANGNLEARGLLPLYLQAPNCSANRGKSLFRTTENGGTVRLMSKLRAALRRPGAGVPAVLIYGPDAAPTPQQEQQFFAGVRLPNGTFKTTSDRRLDDLNNAIGHHLPRRHPLRIKDVAVSSGISTLEWYQALTKAGIECEMTATDIWLHARLVEARGFRVLLDQAGRILQIDVAGWAFQPELAPRKRMFFAAPIALAQRPQLLQRLTRHEYPVVLTSPRLFGNPAVTIVEEDLLAPTAGEWDVIRAANIINRGYFPDSTLQAIIRNLVASLTPEGLLAVCRTDLKLGNRASIFRRAGNGLELVDELNGGSEVAGLAAQLSLSK